MWTNTCSPRYAVACCIGVWLSVQSQNEPGHAGLHILVSAFVIVPRAALLPSTRQPPCHECRRSSLQQQNDDNQNSDDETERMQQLYRQAMEDDKEWFDQFVVGVLGEDAVATVVSNNNSNPISVEPSGVGLSSQTPPPSREEGAALEDSTNNPITTKKDITNRMKEGSESQTGTQGEEPTLFGSTRVTADGRRTVPPNDRIVERPSPMAVSEESDTKNKPADVNTRQRKRVVKEERSETENIVTSTDIPADIQRVLENMSEFAAQDKEQQNASRSPTTSATTPFAATSSQPDTSSPQPDDEKEREPSLEEYWVRYRDAYNSICSVPLQTVLQLGYTTQEIKSLQADALDLIVTDGIPKPKDGVPLHWQIKADGDREVRVGRPRPKPNNNAAAAAAEPSRRSDSGSPRREGRRRARSSSSQEERESMWLDNSEDPSRNKFWMDLPEFRDYLKREAELRLRILGPDWRDWIKTESDWRYALYKDWLWLLEDGVGEPIVGEPKPSRRTTTTRPSQPRPRPSSAVGGPTTERRRERTRPRQSNNMDNDIRMDDSRKQPQRRTERRQRNLDDEDAENTVSRQTRRRSRDMDESFSSSEPMRRTQRRPRPQRSIDDYNDDAVKKDK